MKFGSRPSTWFRSPRCARPRARTGNFFLNIPELDRRKIKPGTIRQQQVQEPLFEFSGACSGCGETPYVKLLSQLFGDRAVVANATGCSSIYGGNLPTTPWAKNADGRGPAWSNSLFEDNAEFGMGFRVSIDKQTEFAHELLRRVAGAVGDDLVTAILNAKQKDESDIYEQRQRVDILKERLHKLNSPEAKQLLAVADMLVKKSVWIVGGDGWAYDIGYGGLDHVLASGRNVNVLVLDTEVYSNTGGQASKSTPRGAVAKFAAGGKPGPKKDLGTHGHDLRQRLRRQRRHGSQGRAHAQGIPRGRGLRRSQHHHRVFVVHRPRHRHDDRHDATRKSRSSRASGCSIAINPERAEAGENPLMLDSRAPTRKVQEFLLQQTRFKMLTKSKPEDAERLWKMAQQDAERRYRMYEYMATRKTEPAAPPKESTGKARCHRSENASRSSEIRVPHFTRVVRARSGDLA